MQDDSLSSFCRCFWEKAALSNVHAVVSRLLVHSLQWKSRRFRSLSWEELMAMIGKGADEVAQHSADCAGTFREAER
jgi:hypothetical protein